MTLTLLFVQVFEVQADPVDARQVGGACETGVVGE
jgi:hypothetical protein